MPLREQLELDSMDFLDIVMELRKRYRVQIPEDDYLELASACKARSRYLEPRCATSAKRRCQATAEWRPMYDTIIIGAGMSGLAAGIRLAYFEQRVCILERHTTIGGLNSFYRLGAATTTSACTP